MKLPNWLIKIDNIIDYCMNKIFIAVFVISLVLLGIYCDYSYNKQIVKDALIENSQK